VPIHIPIHVTSLQSDTQFSEVCETLVVSAHGCALRLPIPLDTGSLLHLHTQEGRQATAYVVACVPIGSKGEGWRLGARLDRPNNFWGLESCPDDWRVIEMPAPAQKSSQKVSPEPVVIRKPQAPAKASQAVIEKIEEQLSEDRLRGILAKLVRPLQAEVTELNEKLSRHARQNRFEVSLGHIPPQLEQKLWERLRADLGTQVIEQTRQQSAEILAKAKNETEQKVTAALTEFRHRLSGELHTVEQRAQALSKEITTTARQHMNAGVEKLQQQALDAGAQLSAQGAKLLSSLEQSLVATQNVHRKEMEQIHSAAATKASQLETKAADLHQRIGALNEAVRHLESDLDSHLERVAGEIVAGSRTELESAVATAFKDFQVRSSNELDTLLDQVCGHLRTIQNRIENSFSGSLKAQGEEAAQAVEQQFERLAYQSMERWRIALAKDLSAVAKSLGQQVREEFACVPPAEPVPTAE
jgi:hypothetical protein